MVKQSAVAANQTLPNSDTHVTKTCNDTELSQILTATRGLHHNVQKLHITTSAHHYQCTSLPVHITTSAHHYQCTSLPVHITTSAHHYQCPSLPVHITTSAHYYQCTSLSAVEIIHRQFVKLSVVAGCAVNLCCASYTVFL